MENREYNTQRTCGVWLVYIGVIIIVSAMSGGELLIQPFILGIGYSLGYFLIFVLPYLNRKLAYGNNSKFQDKMDNITIIVTITLCTICGLFIGLDNLRLLWLFFWFLFFPRETDDYFRCVNNYQWIVRHPYSQHSFFSSCID